MLLVSERSTIQVFCNINPSGSTFDPLLLRGQPRIIIRTNFQALKYLMLYIKTLSVFKKILKGFTIYHLGQLTANHLNKLLLPHHQIFNMNKKFGFHWSRGFRIQKGNFDWFSKMKQPYCAQKQLG